MTVPRDIADIPWRQPWAPIPSVQCEERLTRDVGRKHLYQSVQEWIDQRMIPDADEWNGPPDSSF